MTMTLGQVNFGAVSRFRTSQHGQKYAATFVQQGKRAEIQEGQCNVPTYVFTGKDAQKYEDLTKGIKFTEDKLRDIDSAFNDRIYPELGELRQTVRSYVETMNKKLVRELSALLSQAKPGRMPVTFGKVQSFEASPRRTAYERAEKYAETQRKNGTLAAVHGESADKKVTVFTGVDYPRYEKLRNELSFLSTHNDPRSSYGIARTMSVSMFTVDSLETQYRAFVTNLVAKTEAKLAALIAEATPAPRS